MQSPFNGRRPGCGRRVRFPHPGKWKRTLTSAGRIWYKYIMITVTDTLKAAIKDSGLSDRALGKLSGVNRLIIGRYMRGEQHLRGDNIDALCVALNLELKPMRRRGKAKKES